MAEMRQPNWFDQKYEDALKAASAEDALALIGKDERLIQEVKFVLAEYDSRHETGRSSRSQMIRSAVAEALERTP